MNAPRKRPSVSPPLVTICSATEIAPALSPQLKRPRGQIYIAPGMGENSARSGNVHGYFTWVASEGGDVLLDPAEREAFWETNGEVRTMRFMMSYLE